MTNNTNNYTDVIDLSLTTTFFWNVFSLFLLPKVRAVEQNIVPIKIPMGGWNTASLE